MRQALQNAEDLSFRQDRGTQHYDMLMSVGKVDMFAEQDQVVVRDASAPPQSDRRISAMSSGHLGRKMDLIELQDRLLLSNTVH